MKTVKRIILMGLLVALYGCVAVHKEWRPLSPVDKQMIPYKKGDTVRFIDEKGTLSLLTVDRDITYKELYGESFTDILYEVRDVRLSSERGDLSFYVDVASLRRWSEGKYVFVGIESFEGEYRYDARGSFKDFGDGNARYFYDSIEINNYVYRHVAMQEEWKKEDHWQVYYNTDYGILQVMRNDKNIFTLVP